MVPAADDMLEGLDSKHYVAELQTLSVEVSGDVCAEAVVVTGVNAALDRRLDARDATVLTWGACGSGSCGERDSCDPANCRAPCGAPRWKSGNVPRSWCARSSVVCSLLKASTGAWNGSKAYQRLITTGKPIPRSTGPRRHWMVILRSLARHNPVVEKILRGICAACPGRWRVWVPGMAKAISRIYTSPIKTRMSGR